jgi:hypothetical protein
MTTADIDRALRYLVVKMAPLKFRGDGPSVHELKELANIEAVIKGLTGRKR